MSRVLRSVLDDRSWLWTVYYPEVPAAEPPEEVAVHLIP